MSTWRPLFLNLAAAVACVVVSTARPNGDQFFRPKEIPGNPQYVVFGNVKDGHGHYLNHATVTVSVPEHQFEVTAQTDVLGRFRAPDVGREIQDLGYQVDPSQIMVTVDYPGYHIAHREYRGKYHQKKGAVEMNFLMEKND
jgi:hypothetical protein